MFKTGFFYHFLTAVVFIGMGAYFITLNPSLLEIRGINPIWFGGILLIWGIFRGVNGYLMMRKRRNAENEK